MQDADFYYFTLIFLSLYYKLYIVHRKLSVQLIPFIERESRWRSKSTAMTFTKTC